LTPFAPEQQLPRQLQRQHLALRSPFDVEVVKEMLILDGRQLPLLGREHRPAFADEHFERRKCLRVTCLDKSLPEHPLAKAAGHRLGGLCGAYGANGCFQLSIGYIRRIGVAHRPGLAGQAQALPKVHAVVQPHGDLVDPIAGSQAPHDVLPCEQFDTVQAEKPLAQLQQVIAPFRRGIAFSGIHRYP